MVLVDPRLRRVVNSGTWADRLADFLISAYASRIPDEVLERAALQMLDSVACAAGAHGSGPVRIAVESIAEVKGGEATVWFESDESGNPRLRAAG